jgi:threonine dehydrogenase-like Zn-dependent dehydrogenase
VKGLVWHGGARLEVEDLPEPAPAGGEVLLEVSLAGICGSDLHPYRGHAGPRRPPLVLGHEAVGFVAGEPGRYAAFPLLACGGCRLCLRDRPNLCERRSLLGLDRQGAFAERVAVPRGALVPLPGDLDERAAALVEPLAIALAAVRVEGVAAGDEVLVLGCGPIGLLSVYACGRAGARVAAADPVAARRGFAGRLGAATTVGSAAELPTGFADLAIDAVSTEATWTAAVAAVRPGGSVGVIGLAQAEGIMAVGDLVRRAITVRGHYAYLREDFEAAVALLVAHPPPLDWVEVVGLEEGAEAFRRLVEEPESAVKIVLAPGRGA